MTSEIAVLTFLNDIVGILFTYLAQYTKKKSISLYFYIKIQL